jgi:hypothetical protein
VDEASPKAVKLKFQTMQNGKLVALSGVTSMQIKTSKALFELFAS